jgi:hypothetical protein
MGYQYTRGTEFSAMAPVRGAKDSPLSGVDSNGDPVETPTTRPYRAISVSVDCTVTGMLADQSTLHTTHELKAGMLHPIMFKVVTSASNSATVKLYY